MMLMQAFQPMAAQLSFESCAAIGWKACISIMVSVRQGPSLYPIHITIISVAPEWSDLQVPVMRWAITQNSKLPSTQNLKSCLSMPTLSSLVALQVVVMTTCGAASDDKFGIMTTLSHQCQSLMIRCTEVKQLSCWSLSTKLHYALNMLKVVNVTVTDVFNDKMITTTIISLQYVINSRS